MILIWVLLVVFLSGCSSSNSTARRLATTGIVPGEAIAILPDCMVCSHRSNISVWVEVQAYEASLRSCIQEAMHEIDVGFRLVFLDEFRTIVFPGVKPSDLPSCFDIMKTASVDSRVNSSISHLGLRYLVCVSGVSYSRQEQPLVSNVFLGVARYRHNEAGAEIYDLRALSHSGTISTSSDGTGLVGILPPLYIPEGSATKACKEFGKEVARFLVSKEPPDLQPPDSARAEEKGMVQTTNPVER